MQFICSVTVRQLSAVFFFGLGIFFLSAGVAQSTLAGAGALKLIFSNNMAAEHLACG